MKRTNWTRQLEPSLEPPEDEEWSDEERNRETNAMLRRENAHREDYFKEGR